MQALLALSAAVKESIRHLKEVYYTTRSPETKEDTKDLLECLLRVRTLTEELVNIVRSKKTRRFLAGDRTADAHLTRWSDGLPRRTRNYKEKHKSLSHTHLHRYYETLRLYLNEIETTLDKWVTDTKAAADLPHLPSD